MSPFRDWALHLVRRDGLESREIDLRRGRHLLVIIVPALLLVGIGLLAGLFVATLDEATLVAELEAEVEMLRSERAMVSELAARLEQVEDRYRSLQDAVTQGRPDAAPAAAVPVGQSPAMVARALVEDTSLAWPLTQRGFITRTFGSRTESAGERHTGLDIAVPTGSYVRAIRGGRVEAAGEDSVYGSFLRIAHADGLTSLYGHNSWLFAAPGDEIERLQVIALSGNTGRSTAPHLHLELARNGSLLDPLTLVTDNNLRGGGALAPSEQR